MTKTNTTNPQVVTATSASTAEQIAARKEAPITDYEQRPEREKQSGSGQVTATSNNTEEK